MLMRNYRPTAHLSNANFLHEKHYEIYIKCNNLLHVNNRPSYPTLQNYVTNVYSLNDKYLDKVLFVHMNVLFISCYYCHAFKKLCFLTVCINCLGKDMTRQISFCFKGVVFHLLNLKLDLLLGNYENRRLICCN